jgi:hypothetical protein
MAATPAVHIDVHTNDEVDDRDRESAAVRAVLAASSHGPGQTRAARTTVARRVVAIPMADAVCSLLTDGSGRAQGPRVAIDAVFAGCADVRHLFLSQ